MRLRHGFCRSGFLCEASETRDGLMGLESITRAYCTHAIAAGPCSTAAAPEEPLGVRLVLRAALYPVVTLEKQLLNMI
jgi:hypothetical protein